MSIFKAYDVRGIYPTEINEMLMENIGRAFADFIKGKNIAVGYDMRLSSPSLFKAFVNGVLKQGKNVIDFGLTSTPMSYFACAYLKADGCAMITASHNPKEYNGVKFTKENAIPISGDTGIETMERIVKKKSFKSTSARGEISKRDVKEAYAKHLLSFSKGIKTLKVVVDAGNGMGAQEFGLIQKNLPGKTIPLFFEIDGSFPNHDSNPMKEGAMDILRKRVVKEKADIGIIFDGDADRVFFVDEKGEALTGDIVTALIAEEILRQNKGATVLYDLRSSWVVKETIEKNKGRALECRVGHSFIKAQMRKVDAIFAGELSGHFYFRDNFFTDSGILTAIWMLKLMSSESKPLSILASPLKKYSCTGEINSEVLDKDAVLGKLTETYRNGRLSLLDGIKIEFSDWWFNVRASNTEPLLRLNLEAKTKKLMESKRDEVLKIIRSS